MVADFQREMAGIVDSENFPTLIKGSTYLEEEISFTWYISNATEVMDTIRRQESGIRSPYFTTSPPGWNLSWYLSLEKSGRNRNGVELSLWQDSEVAEKSIMFLQDCTYKYGEEKCFKELIIVTEGCCEFGCHTISDLTEHVKNNQFNIKVSATAVEMGGKKGRGSDNIDEDVPCKVQSLYSGLRTLFDNELFVDMTMKCGEREFKVHKAVLAAQSPVFKSMFEADMRETQSGLIDIPDTDPEVISDMLRYLYTGRVPNIATMARELLVIAEKYNISALLARCERELKSDVDETSFVDLLLFADSHNASRLKKACLNYYYRNSSEIHHAD